MTLKEKFDDVEFNEYGINTVKCEKIADDFAIGFAEWLFEHYNIIDCYDRKELLEKFKQEKGL